MKRTDFAFRMLSVRVLVWGLCLEGSRCTDLGLGLRA